MQFGVQTPRVNPDEVLGKLAGQGGSNVLAFHRVRVGNAECACRRRRDCFGRAGPPQLLALRHCSGLGFVIE